MAELLENKTENDILSESEKTSVLVEEPQPVNLEEKEGKNVGIELQDQTNLLPTRSVVLVFVGLALPTMLLFFDQTIVATALPSISKSFNAGSESIWVGSAYLLTSTAFLPSTGRLSDIFGRKILLIVSLGIFLISSLACAVAQSMLQLIIFRAFQGVGGGAIITLVLIIIGDVVSLSERGKYQGILEAIIAISNGKQITRGLGPLLGGVFASSVGWRWCFWINLPLGAISVVLIIFLLPLRRVKGQILVKVKQVDWVGTALTLTAAILLLLALNWGGIQYPWSSGKVLAPLIVGLAAFVALWLWEWLFAVLPIVPMYLFRNPTVVGVFLCTLSNGLVYFQLIFFIPQFFQITADYSPIRSGAGILPLLIVVTIFVFLSGQATARWKVYRPFIYFGFAVASIGNGLLSTIGSNTSQGKISGFLVLLGIGMGCTFQTTLLAAQSAVERKDMAVLTSFRNFTRSIGATLGLSIGSALLNNTLRSAASSINLSHDELHAILDDPLAIRSTSDGKVHLTPEQLQVMLEGYTQGFHRIFYICAGSSTLAFVAAVLLIKHHELGRKDDAELKAQSKAWLESKKKGKKSENNKDIEEGEKGKGT